MSNSMKAYKAFQEDFMKEQQREQLHPLVIEDKVVTPNRVRIYARNVESKQLQWCQYDHRVMI